MLRKMLRTVTLAAVAVTAFAPTALAASSDQIHRDAADGSIDGSYTLAEMREADRTVSAEQREYFAWDDVYAAYLRQLQNPDVVPPVPAVDTDKDGKIEPEEREQAKRKLRAKCTKATAKAKRSKVCRAVGVDTPSAEPAEDDGDDEEDEQPAKSSTKDDDDGTSPLLWLIVGIPLLVVALGAYRMRSRSKGDPTA